ncbi:phosphoribosylanthranilate isomerase [Thermosyntropha sp.]|uniref:phosphoribosylanthranilate isomerase n=1 Tax=Thermosyntropha sp. TaxID=2740820 RepID=UPI0025CF0F3C|nr:phosphoribosylanthranilate isomerase [Thermosyntropha sp.]MBO8158768.1 phosphoribosylanthranilate isomerase [Thermosyntropha sp.]
MTLVKICGIRTETEALFCQKYGAWAIGEVFAPSKRRIEVEEAARINQRVGEKILKIGVFVDEKLENLLYIARSAFLDMVQLHGEESPEYAEEIYLPVIKCFKVGGEVDEDEFKRWRTWAYLFDTADFKVAGGTGKTFNWDFISHLKDKSRIILAGGLSPDNVKEAVLKIRPMAVDVSSGVEFAGRGKDPEKVKRFIAEVKEADRCVS